MIKKGVFMSKQIQTPTDVVRIEKSGVRFNAWDTNVSRGHQRLPLVLVRERLKVVIY